MEQVSLVPLKALCEKARPETHTETQRTHLETWKSNLTVNFMFIESNKNRGGILHAFFHFIFLVIDFY